MLCYPILSTVLFSIIAAQANSVISLVSTATANLRTWFPNTNWSDRRLDESRWI